ncbi:LPS-assembly protein LptD [Aequorivita sp. F47161]|uniref:LPS-assembly protein LptD n=1 Tax=Aequorivita vitellina TaxID=2874475 RepID=A0A9X1U308_9FLAO|nr:putative LPS assembly protein LptD [Aequorivita vitellina]MCG2419103.1 LPS-assembly protein LptD [Aequorivita vitellina]MCZ4319814.1 putative LPS assembly protein LptD [Aequorivita viscosa]
MTVSNIEPNLQNNSISALQTNGHYLTIFLTILLLCSHVLRAQDLPQKNEAELPKTTQNDTLSVNLKPVVTELNEQTQDTVKTDSIKPAKEILTDVVDYYGEDYVLLNRKENKVYMYNNAYIIYGDMRIDAGLIILDYNKNEVYAKGIDSAGVYSQRPIFVQATNKVEPDSIRYNFDSEKALVFNSRTEQNGFRVISEVTKKVNDSVVYLRNVKFTTSKNIDDPEYYFYTRKAKFVPKKKIVTGLTNMFIADVPTPVGLPFAYFPLTEDRTSGFIIPSFGDNNSRGFFLQNGGYYFAINDYLDLSLLGDYYTNGSYALRGETSYAFRYKFRGNVSARFEKLIDEERGFPGFGETSIYNIRWSHSQDPKSSPNSRFSASVNIGSSKYFSESINQTNNASALVNTLSSSVSYSKTFEGEPQVNLSLAATHSQNTKTQAISMSLPNMNASVSRIYPFAPKDGTKKGIIQNINFQYDVSAENRIQTTDSLFFKPEMFNTAQIGAQHNIPLTTNFKIFNYLSASAGTNYRETWVLKSTRKRYDENINNGLGGIVQDTVAGFESYRTYNFSTSLGTTLYGLFNFGNDKKIQAIRHVVRPSIGYNINPAFDRYYDEFLVPETADEAAHIVEYSRFENTLYGAPNKVYSSSIGMSLSNTFEAKMRDRDTTALEPKKVTLLNNLNFSTAYNLAGDSLKWSPLQFTGSIPIIPKLDFNFSGSLDPYALDSNNKKIDVFNIDNGGSLFRLTNANISINYSFSSKDFDGSGRKNLDRTDNETFRNGGRPDDLFGEATDIYDGQIYKEDEEEVDKTNVAWYNYTIPWDMRLAYTITYGNGQRQNEISSQSLMVSTNMELAPRWTVGVSSGYDFKNKGVTLTQFRFQRDLESWQMSFNWSPIGSINTAWYFFIGIKSSVLSDIKYDKRRESDKRL